MASSGDAFAISDSNSNNSSELPPISPVHIDFDDLRNDILEMENSNSQAVFDQLLSDFSNIPDENQVDTEANAKDDNQPVDSATIEIEDDEVSIHSTVDSAKSGRSGVSGIKLVPIESLMQSTVDSGKKVKKDKRTVKCHSESSASVEELSSETKSDDSDDVKNDDDVEFSRSRHKRKTRNKTDLKKRFQKLREQAQARRPNYAERSNSEESDESNGDGSESENADNRQKTQPKNRSVNTKASSSKKQKDIYSATVRLTKLPSNLETLLYKYDLIEIRDRHQKILASRPRTNRNEKQAGSVSKRSLNDGNCKTNNENVDNQLTEPAAKKQKLNDHSEATTSKKSGKHKPTLRKQNQRPRYAISSDSSSNNDSSVSDKNNDDSDASDTNRRRTRTMRKKNIPKSSTDVTDSNNSASENNNSDDEPAENNGAKSSSSEVEVRSKRKRIPVRKQDPSDDDDEEYEEPKKKYKRRKRIKKVSDSSDENTPKKSHGRKNIRKVIRTADLEQETKEAAKHEIERKKRIEERQKLYNQMYDTKLEEITELDKLVLDFDPETKEELISVDKKLVKKLKPHQAQGVKFMWDACFESLEKLNENHGGGCILAHCMGLGKTLQVVTLVHTLLTHSEQTNVEKVLIICPVSTVLNWVNEFKIWLRHCSKNRDIEIYEISKYKQNAERAYRISEWHNEGGVLILGYDMFRNLSSETNRIRKKQKEIFQEGLINPGPDLVVCDEGHLLKNAKTSLSKAVNRLTTMRRIVLTGTPLQNNLNEYYCMVQFVKPNLLGKYNEYLNRFVNPITNGQYTDSTPYDIQMMKRRSHILHKLLDGCVQRRDYAVLAPFLPPKQEYVLYVRLTKLQVDLYKYYMQNRPQQNESGRTRSSILFQDFQNLQRIWTHPRVLRYNSDRYEQMVQKKKFLASDDEEGSLKDFIDDDDDDDDSDDSDLDNSSNSSDSEAAASSNGSSVQSISSDKPSNSKKAQQQQGQGSRRTRSNAKDFDPEPIEPIKEENPTEWWMPLCPEEELNNIEYSGKLMLLFSILAECEACGDKLLVFSQSLFSLDVIEHFLAMIDENTQNPNPEAKLGGFTGSWARGVDYFRLDGSTNIETRNANCNNFNSDENSRARLFLISTRAGGLGINLVAANRVIIFDASWNPSHDIQSIFRIYRFGQKKPCYIYRFIAYGTMEEKIYERQVTKLAISKRVIDEHQIDRHYKENDLNELYNIENIDPEGERPLQMLPKDRLFAEQLQKYPDRIWKYHEHDSLLENKSEETLSKEEIEAAWKEFEEEKNRPTVQQTFVGYPTYQRAPGTGPVTSNNIFGFRTDILLQLLNIKARRAYPGAQNITDIVPMLLKHLYETMEKNDTSFYQELLYIQQTEMAAPSQGSYLTPAGHIMPAYSGRGRPPLNPQQQPQQHGQVQHVQQQHLIQAAQNRLMNMNNGNPRLPAPTVSPQVIEID